MRYRLYFTALVLLVLALLLASCGTGPTSTPVTQQPAATEAVEPEVTETQEYRWNQLLSRDSILPIYDPEFVPASEAKDYDDGGLVMGVVIDGEAKAYPISVLTGREMVIDELAGTPILVTW